MWSVKSDKNGRLQNVKHGVYEERKGHSGEEEVRGGATGD